MRRLSLRLSLIAAMLAAAFAGGYAATSVHGVGAAHAVSAANTQSALQAATGLPDFADLAARYGPAVVNVSVSGTVKTAVPQGQIDPDDPFFQFFRRFGIPAPSREMPTRAFGSGFIIGADGVILTNAHVVASATEVTVALTDKREFPAKVLGIDKATDVAVLRIDAKDLPTVKLGDPSRTRVGEWVVAIGSPFGFTNSVTAGIVSAKSRSLPDEGYVPFIQTDVAVNPGNSGGPLFNLAGEVIGINSQIYSRSGGYQGLSFAIPIDVAMKVQAQLVQHGKVSRGRLGVSIQEVDQALADSFGLKKPAGALVAGVERDSAAARAGVEPGDVILKLDGHEISRSSELPPLVADLKPGSSATLQIWRKGRTRELAVTVGEVKDAKLAAGQPSPADPGRLGLAVRPLTPEERREAEIPGGLLVEEAGGPAARSGIQPGDVILALNGEPVTSVEQLRALVAKAGKRVALLIQREDAKIFVPINLG